MQLERLRQLCETLSHDTGIDASRVYHNASVAVLYEDALRHEEGTAITSSGALAMFSGEKTGRSPKDKRITDEECSSGDVWWGPVNIKMDEHTYMVNHERAVDYLKTRKRIYVFDGFAGWDPRYRVKRRGNYIRDVCSHAALFMHNMLIRPTEEELDNFGKPDFTVLNAGAFPANRYTTGMTSATSIAINFCRGEMVILGTLYAGEMKKGIFTVMNYLMPKRGVLSLHSSANVSPTDPGDVTIFFGLSGTGKTTLSADPRRKLIGDDEHCWSDTGVFNIEGGCYAKCIGLSRAKEPEIFDAVSFGAVLENVVLDPVSRVVDYEDASITENTRCAYPIEHIPHVQVPCMAGHPRNIIMLTCDAFGVLPPVSRLTTAQAMYHFISGYTAKVSGTEEGVTEPTATFSACFGEPFLVWHPTKYAAMLAAQMEAHAAQAWLVNTGWVGGRHGTPGARRCPLAHTRAIIDAIHAGTLHGAAYETYGVFGLAVPVAVADVPADILHPERAWADAAAFSETRARVAALFVENFAKYASEASEDVRAAGPTLS